MPAARSRIPCLRCPSLSPPLLSFLCSPLPSPAEVMRRPTREYRRAISCAHPFLCVIFPVCDRLPLVWRPPDALVIPWRERRRHTNRGCGGEDAPIRSSPRRLGDAIKTMGIAIVQTFKAQTSASSSNCLVSLGTNNNNNNNNIAFFPKQVGVG